MCLVVIGWKAHPDFPLVVAANRDEVHTRVSAAARFWEDCPDIYAGRDIDGGGTWMGVTRAGRFAAVTNYRDPELYREDKLSRGQLVKDFLLGREDSFKYALRVQKCAAKYNPFNLLVCDNNELVWVGYVPSRSCDIVRIHSGIHGISNHLLNTPWPKLVLAKERFQVGLSALPERTAFIRLLQARDYDEPKMSVPTDWDPAIRKLVSSAFIASEAYGTRSSSILTRSTNGEIFFEELTYDALAVEISRSCVKMAMRWP